MCQHIIVLHTYAVMLCEHAEYIFLLLSLYAHNHPLGLHACASMYVSLLGVECAAELVAVMVSQVPILSYTLPMVS